jgi:transposase
MSEGELEKLILEIKASSLSEGSKETITKALLSFLWLTQELERKTLSIKKLLRIFFGNKTEKRPKDPKDNSKNNKPPSGDSGGKPSNNTSSVKGSSSGGSEAASNTNSPESEPKPKGHGKNGHDQYSAEHISVPHPDLKEKDICPSCGVSRLYAYGVAFVLRIFGQAPLQAKVFEREQLRCAGCQELFTAPLPEWAGANRHHESANAMVAFLNYGAGVPFYRLEGVQSQMGVPVADSTQFDMAEKVANCGAPAFEHMKGLAVGAEKQGFDDTPMPVLELMKENEGLSDKDRKGMQTTAVLATVADQKIALFLTGRNHAGENMADLLKDRDPSKPKVIQMSDASPNNFSHDYMDLVIKALCMDHGRRNFHEILEAFPKDCQHVLTELGKVYKNEADAKANNLSKEERLAFHQEHSGLIMNGLNEWMEGKLENREVEPNSALGEAIAYFLKHWNGLTEFLRVAGAPLSNADVEQLVKRCVLRRKASMFYKTQVGAWIGDILTSLIETARINRKNPVDYLEAIQKYARHVREHPADWMPWNYQQTIAALLGGLSQSHT